MLLVTYILAPCWKPVFEAVKIMYEIMQVCTLI